MANYENQILVGGLVLALAFFVLYKGDQDKATEPPRPADRDVLAEDIRKWNRSLSELRENWDRWTSDNPVGNPSTNLAVMGDTSLQWKQLETLIRPCGILTQEYINIEKACSQLGTDAPAAGRKGGLLTRMNQQMQAYHEEWSKVIGMSASRDAILLAQQTRESGELVAGALRDAVGQVQPAVTNVFQQWNKTENNEGARTLNMIARPSNAPLGPDEDANMLRAPDLPQSSEDLLGLPGPGPIQTIGPAPPPGAFGTGRGGDSSEATKSKPGSIRERSWSSSRSTSRGSTKTPR
jgi:hypothetical protein